jgi:hypothetical protein
MSKNEKVDLPIDVIEKIFKHMEIKDLAKAARTCKLSLNVITSRHVRLKDIEFHYGQSAFSDDGKYLVISGGVGYDENGITTVWDLSTGNIYREFPEEVDDDYFGKHRDVTYISFGSGTNGNKFIAIQFEEGDEEEGEDVDVSNIENIWIWNLETNHAHKINIRDKNIEIQNDLKFAYTYITDDSIVFPGNNNNKKKILDKKKFGIKDWKNSNYKFHKDLTLFGTKNYEKKEETLGTSTIKFWDISEDPDNQKYNEYPDIIYTHNEFESNRWEHDTLVMVDFSNNKEWMATKTLEKNNCTLQIWNLVQGSCVKKIKLHDDISAAVFINSNRQIAVTYEHYRSVEIFDLIN